MNLLDLPLAVVSGSVALGFGEPFFRAAQCEVDLRCGLEFARGARVVPGGLGDRGPLVGAARVGWRGRLGVSGAVRPRRCARPCRRRPGTWAVMSPSCCGGCRPIRSGGPALGALRRLARRGWWHRPPFLPVPGTAYWRFRLVTAFGGDGEEGGADAGDVVDYLRWCQEDAAPRRG